MRVFGRASPCARRDRDARRPARRTRPRESPIRTDAPIPSESEVPVPRNRPTRVLNIEDGYYLLVHAPRLARGRRHRETRLGERLVAGRGAPSVPALTPPPVRETRARATRARPYRFLPFSLTEKRPPTGFNTLQTRLLPQSYGRVPQRNPASAAGVRPHPLLRAWPRRLKTPWSAWIIDSRCPSLRRSRCLLGRLLSLGGWADRQASADAWGPVGILSLRSLRRLGSCPPTVRKAYLDRRENARSARSQSAQFELWL